MQKYLSATLVIIILILGVFALSVPSAIIHAQESQTPTTDYNLSISPPTAYIKLHPGNLAVHTVTVKNNGLVALTVTPELVDFSSDGKTGQPVLGDSNTFPYLDLDKTSFEPVTIRPGQAAQLTLHFSVPSTAEDREYPLTVLFEGKEAGQKVASGQTSISGVLASNIIILVSKTGTLENLFSVESFQTSRFVDSFKDISFAPLVKNTNFAAAVASGSATITDWQGKEVAQFDILPSVVLGYSTRQIEPQGRESDSNSENGNSEPGLRIFRYDHPFLIGPYTISLLLPSGNQEELGTVEYKMKVWALPFSILLATASAVLALVGYTLYKRLASE